MDAAAITAISVGTVALITSVGAITSQWLKRRTDVATKAAEAAPAVAVAQTTGRYAVAAAEAASTPAFLARIERLEARSDKCERDRQDDRDRYAREREEDRERCREERKADHGKCQKAIEETRKEAKVIVDNASAMDATFRSLVSEYEAYRVRHPSQPNMAIVKKT